MSLEHSPAREQKNPIARAAYSVPEFCEAHGISRSLLYVAIAEGWGPPIMKVGRRTLISVEGAAIWREAMEMPDDDDEEEGV